MFLLCLILCGYIHRLCVGVQLFERLDYVLKPLGKMQERWIHDKILYEVILKLNPYNLNNYEYQIINILVFKNYFAN